MNPQLHECKISHFDKVDPNQPMAQLGYNDIKSIINECDSDFIETLAARRCESDTNLSNTLNYGEDMDIEDDLYNLKPLVFWIPDPKVRTTKP